MSHLAFNSYPTPAMHVSPDINVSDTKGSNSCWPTVTPQFVEKSMTLVGYFGVAAMVFGGLMFATLPRYNYGL
jgi:hypothetical protein